MGLPERGVAAGWVGKTVLDRGGTLIGACTAVVTDEATDLPEWVWVELDGLAVFVPLVDAIESGGVVRVAVDYADVAAAPTVGETGRVSQVEAAALYRHYGIEFAKAGGTLPPAGGPDWPTDIPTKAFVASGLEVASASGEVTPSPGREVRLWVHNLRPLLLFAGVLGAAVGAVVAAERLRLPARRRVTPADRAARMAGATTAALTARGRQLAGWTAPFLQSAAEAGGRAATAVAPVVAAGARAAAIGGQRGATAGRAGAVSVKRAASRAGRLSAAVTSGVAGAANPGVAGAQRVGAVVGSVPDLVSDSGEKLQKRWSNVMGKLTAGLGFGAGYLLGARAGRERYDQLTKAAARLAQHPQVQQAGGRVKTLAEEKLQTVPGWLGQRATASTATLRRRASSAGAESTETPPYPAADPAGEAGGSPLSPQMPPGPVGTLPDPGTDPSIDGLS